MFSFSCKIQSKEYPSEGEIVMTRTKEINDDNVVRMELLEYVGKEGIVLSSELSKKRARSMHQVTRKDSIEVCQVMKVDPIRNYIDLSLRKPTEDEKEECKSQYRKNKVAYHVMIETARYENKDVSELYQEFGYSKAEEYGSLYSFFSKVKKNEELVSGISCGESILKVINKEFKASKFKVRIDVDIACPFFGVQAIKEAFRKALEGTEGVKGCLLRTPTYSISYVGREKEGSLELVADIARKIEKYITEKGGSFAIVTPAKVYGEKQKHSLLEEDSEEISDDESSDEF